MWIFLNNAFLSIVAPKPGRGVNPRTHLVVRARLKGDIQRAFPRLKAPVTESKKTDYRFRAVVTRNMVAAVLAEHAKAIAYDNFKDSVKNKRRHDAYLRVWSIMFQEQMHEEGKTNHWPLRDRDDDIDIHDYADMGWKYVK